MQVLGEVDTACDWGEVPESIIALPIGPISMQPPRKQAVRLNPHPMFALPRATPLQPASGRGCIFWVSLARGLTRGAFRGFGRQLAWAIGSAFASG